MLAQACTLRCIDPCNLSARNGVFPVTWNRVLIYLFLWGFLILEKFMHLWTNTSCCCYKSIQLGFREKHGTDIVRIVLLDKIASLNNDKIAIGVWSYLSKAFVTVNHGILLMKLYKYEIRGIVIEWFKSDLSDRSQYVSYLNHGSSPMSVNCGFPNGSILSTFLFLLHVKDIYNVYSGLFASLFADDTNVLVKVIPFQMMLCLMETQLSRHSHKC